MSQNKSITIWITINLLEQNYNPAHIILYKKLCVGPCKGSWRGL